MMIEQMRLWAPCAVHSRASFTARTSVSLWAAHAQLIFLKIYGGDDAVPYSHLRDWKKRDFPV
jgi:hypothetical protein